MPRLFSFSDMKSTHSLGGESIRRRGPAGALFGRVALVCIGFLGQFAALAQVFLLDSRGGFDAYHNLAHGAGFSEFRSEIEDRGWGIRNSDRFTADALVGARAVILLQPYRGDQDYSVEEISALSDFVAAGGGLVVVSDGGSGSSGASLNALSGRFGVTFSEPVFGALGVEHSGFREHPIVENVRSMALDYYRTLEVVSGAGSLDLTLGSGEADFLAVAGRSVFLGDSSVLMDSDALGDVGIDSADNRLFARQLVGFLGGDDGIPPVPEPGWAASSAAILLGVGALIRWRSSHRRSGSRSA